jgi:hypothetical protein
MWYIDIISDNSINHNTPLIMHRLSENNASGKEEQFVRCPHCATPLTIRYGRYQRNHPEEPEQVSVQRYRCKSPYCPWKTFSILPYPFLPIVRHFLQTLFFFHCLLNLNKKTQAHTARKLILTRGVVKQLATFCQRFIPWFNTEKHIAPWGPNPEADQIRFWIDFTRDFSQALYPKRWAMF